MYRSREQTNTLAHGFTTSYYSMSYHTTVFVYVICCVLYHIIYN